MAYAFDSIQGLMDENKQQNQNNIFGEGQAATVQPTQPQGGAQVQTKTSTEGDLGNAGSSSNSSSSGGQQAAPTGVAGNQSDRAAFKANAGKTAAPKVFQDIGGSLAANQAAAQKEANEYTKNATTGYQSAYGYNPQDVREAAAGEEKATKKVSSILNAGPVQAPKEFAFSKDYSEPDARMLSTDAGLKNLLSRGQDPNYTSGMAAFDLGSLRKSDGFQSNVNSLQAKAADLDKQLGGYVSDLPQNVRAIGENLFNTSRQGITTGLGAIRANLDKQNAEELAAKNAELERLRKSGINPSLADFEEISKLLPGAQSRANQLDEGAGSFVTPAGVNLNKFATIRDNYTDRDVIDAGEASKYNNIMNLLGLGGPAYEAAGPLSPTYSFDKTGIENEMVKAAVGESKTKKEKARVAKEAQAKAEAEAEAQQEREAARNSELERLAAEKKQIEDYRARQKAEEEARQANLRRIQQQGGLGGLWSHGLTGLLGGEEIRR